MQRPARALCAILLLAAGARSAIRWAPSGVPLRRTDFANIRFQFNVSAAAKISGGDATGAVQAALDAWNAIPGTAVRFSALEATSTGISDDRQNVIAFADTDAARAELGSRVAATHVVFAQDGSILETDILLNPNFRFSTSLEPGTYDLQAVITHELGHALGANHSTVASAAMFWNSMPQNKSQSRLQPDDMAFAVEVYPDAGNGADYGTITGRALKDGNVLRGAEIVAVDAATGVTIGGMSSIADGSFRLLVPAGDYVLFVAPLGPMIPASVMYGMDGSRIDSAFQPAMGDSVRVGAGKTVTASLATRGAVPALAIEAAAGRFVSSAGDVSFGSPVVEAGKSLDFIALGAGLDGSLQEQDIELIGAGVSLHSGSLVVDQNITYSDGRHPLRFRIDTTSATQGAVSILITKGADRAFLAGGILVLASKPFITAASVVSAASSVGSGIAPGELVSLYGLSLGPDEPAIAASLDPATGGLPVALGDVRVTFDGVAAPLLVTSSGQINLQVPFEVAGRNSAVVTVVRGGVSSSPVVVLVVPAHPGLFLTAGTRGAIAVNQDGSINSPAAPAPKGSWVTLYGTGAGAVDPPVPTGKPAPMSPLSFAKDVSVSIGGSPSPIYQGGVLSPGFVGLLQVAVQVPESVPSGAAGVVLTVNGQTSPEASIFVR